MKKIFISIFSSFQMDSSTKIPSIFLKDAGDFLYHYSSPLAELGAEHA